MSSSTPTRARNALGAAYTSAFRRYVRERSEEALQSAYEFGRDAVAAEFSVLDLGAAHHEALAAALREGGDVEAVTQAGRQFLLESLSAFEMVQRGFREAHDAVRAERRNASIVRRLSTLLGDASLALDATDSVQEVVQLLAEQARELTGAAFALAVAELGGRRGSFEAASYAEDDERWARFVEQADVAGAHARVEAGGAVVRTRAVDVLADPAIEASIAEVSPTAEWLGAPLTTLDGHNVGSVHVAAKHGAGRFGEGDEALLVHLAEMASAAIERSRLYR